MESVQDYFVAKNIKWKKEILASCDINKFSLSHRKTDITECVARLVLSSFVIWTYGQPIAKTETSRGSNLRLRWTIINIV